MSNFARVQIYNESGDKPYPTHVKIDGKLIKGVVSIHYDVDVESVPRVTLELDSLMDSGIDVHNPELMIKFHPQTVHEAMTVLGISGMYGDDGEIPTYILDDGK